MEILSSAVTKLADLVAQEVWFLREVKDKVDSLIRLLEWIQASLKDINIDYSIREAELHKVWSKHVRDLAYDAEDIIDDYIFKMHQHTSTCFLTTVVVLPSKLAILHDLGKKIDAIKGRAEEIESYRKMYANQSIGDITSSNSLTTEARPLVRRTRAQDVEEADVLGFDEHFQALERMLIMGDDGNQRRAVVSIVGIGGVGKTTLANKIFSNPGIRRHFTFQAWISVSQEYTAQDASETITEEAMGDKTSQCLRPSLLQEVVFNYLKENKYLVILDDVRSKKAWDSIEGLLPDMMNGSRVLITTRNHDVASHAGKQSPQYELKSLGKEHSWELFCRKAISKCSKDCPPSLESIGREMVEKCRGLPLAIVVLGGLMLTRSQSVEEWRKLLERANWQGENQISEMVALSYHHLPYDIKPCFLYFSIYPKGSLISAKRLIRLWIAEGLIRPTINEETCREQVAEDYLEELVRWSMIQVVERHHNGAIRICQIHELLHDLSISLAQGMNFIHIPNNNNDNEENILQKKNRRRLALHDDKNVTIAELKSTDFTSSLRTVTLMDIEIRTSEMEKFFHSINLLRVLNLCGTGIKSLPNDIGKLIHLRYLGLRYTDLTELPSSISKLTNLQTLDFKNSVRIVELPSQVWKMQRNLRHLEGTGFSIKGLPSTKSLPQLQTLSNVKAGTWLQNGLQKMTNLRKLGVHDVTGTYKEVLLDCLGKGNLGKLTKLAWETKDNGMIPSSLLSTSQHKNNLQVLYLRGPLEGLPDVHCMPASLTKLTLQFTALQVDPLEMLGKLDNLQVLRLRRNAFVGREMVCLEKGFPQLKVLELNGLLRLTEWRIEDQAMPKLRELIIETCGLAMLPRGLQKVSTLQELKVIDMRNYFCCGSLGNNDGEDWEMIKHIPSVRVLREKPLVRAYNAHCYGWLRNNNGEEEWDIISEARTFILNQPLPKTSPVVHRLWERNDIKGVINALAKMSDHAVSADVISVFMGKVDIFSLELCTFLFPLLTSLLESKMDRHLLVSMEMLLKLVKIFGPVIHSTLSAGPSVGVDVQAEQRLERCNLCFIELEKVKQVLPSLTRRGGSLAKTAQELKLTLQDVL